MIRYYPVCNSVQLVSTEWQFIADTMRQSLAALTGAACFIWNPSKSNVLTCLPFNLSRALCVATCPGEYSNSKRITISPDSKVHGANMGPIWGRQDPCGPHVGPINFAIWVVNSSNEYWIWLLTRQIEDAVWDIRIALSIIVCSDLLKTFIDSCPDKISYC